MWPRSKRALLIFLSLAFSIFGACSRLHHISAGVGSAWVSLDAPQLSKVVELPANSIPDDYANICTKTAYIPDGQLTPRIVCTYLSPFGVLTADGQIQLGSNKFAHLTGPSNLSTFITSPIATRAFLSVPAPTIGNELGIYYSGSKSDLQAVFTDGMTVSYQVTKQPDVILRNPSTHQPLQINTNDMAFSSNGEWMLADMPQGGLVRVNMNDLSTQLFAAPIEPAWFLGLANPALAISNDGRYAAANTDNWGTGNLNVYDLSTCSDQLDVLQKDANYCAGKNILQGWTLDSRPMGKGLLSEQSDLQYPTDLQFADDDTLNFTARYEAKSLTEYKIAEFTATAPGAIVHKLGLLGMGDSYISGEGAFDYTQESDDGNDTCHISPVAYPFLLGRGYFNSYNSIACSGAKTDKLVGTNQKFQGQVKDRIEEGNRNKPNILANFLPGYIYQQEFASNYLPETLVLSVGGDDIGFADIVKSCVANSGGGTCYNTYEDRVELVNRINATYSKLVKTYTTLRNESGGARMYVVGYPQVAKTGGDCGLNVHLNADEIIFASQLIDYLDSVVQRAAQTAGVFYVNTQHAFDGHRLCESGSKAMNGFTVGGDAGTKILGHEVNFVGSESYHPTPLGYQLLAQTIADQTRGLSAPMPIPVPFGIPVLDPSIPLLTSASRVGRTIQTVSYNTGIADDVVLRGDADQVTVNDPDLSLQPGSKYQVVLHSTPILLDEGGVGSNGVVTTTVHIPNSTEPGYHTLHVHATSMAGEAIDIQKIVYIAASADDYNGDGVPNDATDCLLVSLSHEDVDQDGIDDACDPDITAQPVAVTSHAGSAASKGKGIGVQSGDASAVSAAAPLEMKSVLGASKHPAAQQSVLGLQKTEAHLFRLNWLQLSAAVMSFTVCTTVVISKKT